jgi:uncharacterized protein (TIGR03435 family)
MAGNGKAKIISKRGSAPEIDYFGISIGTLAEQLSLMRAKLIVDETGLEGIYNIQLVPLDEDPTQGDEGGRVETSSQMPIPWDLQRLGLGLKPIRLRAETLVIDHIHRPSAN